MNVSWIAAFGAGLFSFLAPCVVPLLPVYLSYVSGVAIDEIRVDKGRSRLKMWWYTGWFVVGFVAVYVGLGLTASAISGFLLRWRGGFQTLGGVFLVLLGIDMMEIREGKIFNFGSGLKVPGWAVKLGAVRAMVIGVVFALTWSPCVGPVLGAILTLAASKKTMWEGGGLLLLYALGIAIPFVVLALVVDRVSLPMSRWEKWWKRVAKVGGVIMVVIGLLMANNAWGLVSKKLTLNFVNGYLTGRWGL